MGFARASSNLVDVDFFVLICFSFHMWYGYLRRLEYIYSPNQVCMCLFMDLIGSSLRHVETIGEPEPKQISTFDFTSSKKGSQGQALAQKGVKDMIYLYSLHHNCAHTMSQISMHHTINHHIKTNDLFKQI